jgi:hypothetical protein
LSIGANLTTAELARWGGKAGNAEGGTEITAPQGFAVMILRGLCGVFCQALPEGAVRRPRSSRGEEGKMRSARGVSR